jgi:hypothetical protein
MLDIARRKGGRLPNLVWVLEDMRDFDLGRRFGLVIVPGHSFQNLQTPVDHHWALRAIRRHLLPGGRFVLHLDHLQTDWLRELAGPKRGVFEPAEDFVHPRTGRLVRTTRAWSYEPATQTALASTVWEELNDREAVIERVERGPSHYHCFFPDEVRHLLAMAGFEVRDAFGDFFRGPLAASSEEMIWLATAHAGGEACT